METIDATWEPHTKHGRLTKQSDLPDSVFACPTLLKEPQTNIEKAAEYYGVELAETDWHKLVTPGTDAK
jgi:hypothetical protein